MTAAEIKDKLAEKRDEASDVNSEILVLNSYWRTLQKEIAALEQQLFEMDVAE